MSTATKIASALRAIAPNGKLAAEDVPLINQLAALWDARTAVGVGIRRVSKRGIDLIHSFESLRLTTYKDPGSVNGLPITGGWGTTVDENGRPFKLGRTEPKEYWDRLFARDLARFEDGVTSLIGSAPTTQNQFDALVSFAYNVGLDIDADTIAEGLGDSTLLKKHLAGDYAGAAREFHKWNKNDGKVLKGLVRRRAAEAELYLS